MPNPQGTDLYISQPLTTISTAYAQTNLYVADRVFPVVPVLRQGDIFWKYPQGDWKRTVAGIRAPATETPGGGWEMEMDNYFAYVYGVHKDVDDQTATNSAGGGFNLYAEAAQWVTEQLLLKRDRMWIDTYMKPGTWKGGVNSTGGAANGDLVGAAASSGNEVMKFNLPGSDPIGVVEAQTIGMAQSGVTPNVAVMGPDVYRALRNNQSIIERIKYTQPGWVADDLIASVLGVDRVVVTWATENIAPKGADDEIVFMNRKSMLLAYAPPAPGLQTMSAGYIFAWTGLLGAGAWGTRIKRFRMEQIASDRIEGEMAYDMKVVAPQAGVFFSNIVD